MWGGRPVEIIEEINVGIFFFPQRKAIGCQRSVTAQVT